MTYRYQSQRIVPADSVASSILSHILIMTNPPGPVKIMKFPAAESKKIKITTLYPGSIDTELGHDVTSPRLLRFMVN